MECYKVIHYEPHFSEDELNHILNSSLFKKAFYAFAKRNPYYARTLFYHDSISVIANLCEIAV